MNLHYAYLAGYTDGDGCFHIRRILQKKFQSSFIISSTNPNVLEHFKSLFGGNVRFVQKNAGQKAQYHYLINGKAAHKLCEAFFPYLIEKKNENSIFSRFHLTLDKQERLFLIEEMSKAKSIGRVTPNHKNELENIANTIEPTEEDFAYLAGFIDAECSLGIQRYSSKHSPHPIYKAILQCNNTRYQSLMWAISRFGGQIHFISRKKFRKNHNDQLTWRLCSKALHEILPRIFPYLITKKPVCEELIKFSETIVSLNKTISRNSPKFAEFYQPIIQKRDLICENVHRLNRKGS